MSTAPYIAVARVLDRIHTRLAEHRLVRQLRADLAYVDRVENTAVLAGVLTRPGDDCHVCDGVGRVENADAALLGAGMWADCVHCDGTGIEPNPDLYCQPCGGTGVIAITDELGGAGETWVPCGGCTGTRGAA